MSSNENLLCRRVPSALQYDVPNINTHPEDYYYQRRGSDMWESTILLWKVLRLKYFRGSEP